MPWPNRKIDVADPVHGLHDADTVRPDRRLCVDESELGRLLKVVGRDGSTLGQSVRSAWDGRKLEVRSRTKTTVARDPHVSMIAQITAEELRARMTDVETNCGTANRFLYALVRQGPAKPSGETSPAACSVSMAGAEAGHIEGR